MKKKLFTLLIMYCFLNIFAISVYAEIAPTVKKDPVEKNSVKIVIDGEQGKYSKPPIMVGDRILLPLREVLVKLGVTNDNQHIIWDGSNKCVTVKKDSKKIVLNINKKTAYVNDLATLLDTEPIIYQSCTYIPVRFVSMSLKKKVEWDGETNTVAICDEEQYDNISKILENSYSSMENIKYRIKSNIKIVLSDVANFNSLTEGATDPDKKIQRKITKEVLKSKKENTVAISEQFIINGFEYKKENGVWLKPCLYKDNIYSLATDFVKKIMVTGLVLKSKDVDDIIIIEGDVGLVDVNADKDDTEYVLHSIVKIDKKTNYIIEISSKSRSKNEIDGIKIPCTINLALDFYDHNGNFGVLKPTDLNVSSSSITSNISSVSINNNPASDMVTDITAIKWDWSNKKVIFNSKSVVSKQNSAQSLLTLKTKTDKSFKVVQFTDIHGGSDIDPKTDQLINQVIKSEKPDLVVFTGDNITWGCDTSDKFMKAVGNIARRVEENHIPWLISFGNHDEELTPMTKLSKEDMLEIYMSYPYNVNKLGPTDVSGYGNMNILINDSKGIKPVYNIWAIDSGSYAPKTIDGRNMSLSGYDWIKPNQIKWYWDTSVKLEEKYNKKMPSLMFFHIPLIEFNEMWKTKDTFGVVGERNEVECPQSINSGLFSTALERGDVKGIFVGHDHVNNYVGNYHGIFLGYSGNTGFGTYGLKDSQPNRLRGARIFNFNENSPNTFETNMVFAKDYGIQ